MPTGVLSKILTTDIFGVYRDIDEYLVGSAIISVHNYMDRIDALYPAEASQSTSCRDEFDSQGSLDWANVNVERKMMIHVCSIDTTSCCITILTWTATAPCYLGQLCCDD